VFTANQTENAVLLALGIAGSGNLPVLAPLVSLDAILLEPAPSASCVDASGISM